MAEADDKLTDLIESPRESLDVELKSWIDPATPPNFLAASWHHFVWSERLIFGGVPLQSKFRMYTSKRSSSKRVFLAESRIVDTKGR